MYVLEPPCAQQGDLVLTIVLAIQAENQPGFPNALLDILQAEQNNAVQLSGTITPPSLFFTPLSPPSPDSRCEKQQNNVLTNAIIV